MFAKSDRDQGRAAPIKPSDRKIKKLLEWSAKTRYIAIVKNNKVTETLSWGNDYDNEGKGLFVRNRPDDLKAASEVFNSNDPSRYIRRKIGFGPEIDPFVRHAFRHRELDYLTNKNEGRHTWKLTNTCQHEARNVADDPERAFNRALHAGPWDKGSSSLPFFSTIGTPVPRN